MKRIPTESSTPILLGRLRVQAQSPLRSPTGRRGWSIWTSLFILMGLSAPVAAWSFIPNFFGGETPPNVLTAEAELGPFINRILEQGEIEASRGIEVRCEVRSRNSSGTNIIQIVPAGTRVEQGDLLVKLDDSALQQDLIQQQIAFSASESLAIESRAALEASKIARDEYEEGTFREQSELLESLLVVAEENLRRAQEYLVYSKQLAERGYVSKVQLQADAFAVQKADKEREVAKTKLEVLQKFSRRKMLNQLTADIQTTTAKVRAREKTLELDQKRLEEIQEQIAKCRILAPGPGQVVYGNDPRRASSSEQPIMEGVPVRERQVIIRLPDPEKMRVLAKVHESRISHIKKGMTSEITSDALPGRVLTGTVATVGEYPLPSLSVYTAHVKEYAVEIDIHSPPEELRTAMTAQVDILVEHFDSQLQIPVGAVIPRGTRHFVAVPVNETTFETREIKVGSSNDASIIVKDGLELGEKVVLNHADIKDKLDLPDDVLTPLVPESEVTKTVAKSGNREASNANASARK